MGCFVLERVRGIEPLPPAWKARVLPLYDTRELRNYSWNKGKFQPQHVIILTKFKALFVQETKSKTVFIIEDEEFLVKVYRYILEQAGFSVWVAYDGKNALEFLPKDPPGCILLDIMLPEKSGFELIQVFAGDTRWKSTPIIILSNLGRPEDVSMGKELGAKDYLVKANVDVESIVRTVRKYV